MASGLSVFRLEKFRGGDGTDNITNLLKKFDRYVDLCNVKPEQQYDLLCLQLEGRAQWYIDSLNPPPADLAALKLALKNKFAVEKQIKMDIFNTKNIDIESIDDFVYRVEKQTHMLELPEQLKVQIAVGGLHPNIQSAIQSHGPKTLDEVRTLANRVQQHITAVSAVSAPQEGALQQILGLLEKMTMTNNQHQQPRPQSTNQQCMGCGGRSCKSRNSCPPKGKICHHCGLPNHFRPVCRQAQMKKEQKKQQ